PPSNIKTDSVHRDIYGPDIVGNQMPTICVDTRGRIVVRPILFESFIRAQTSQHLPVLTGRIVLIDQASQFSVPFFEAEKQFTRMINLPRFDFIHRLLGGLWAVAALVTSAIAAEPVH